jgi:hypothetical protein
VGGRSQGIPGTDGNQRGQSQRVPAGIEANLDATLEAVRRGDPWRSSRVRALVERQPIPVGLKMPAALNGRAGVYALFSSSGTILYFGKATDLRVEIKQTLQRMTTTGFVLEGVKNGKHAFRTIATRYSAFAICRGDSDFRHDVEALILRMVINDTFNRNLGHFKRTS